LSVRQRKPPALRPRTAALRTIALGVTLAFAVAQGVVCAPPAWAQDDGGGGDNGGPSAGPSGNSSASSGGGGGHGAGTAHDQWFGAAGQRWLTNSAARLTAPLRVFIKRTQRVSAHAASDLVKTGQTTISAPLNWLAGKVKASPDDQDKAMAAVRSGEIVPLASVLKTVEKSVPGDVLNVDLSHDVVGSWNYKITVLTPQGYYRDVNVDAGSNNVTSIRPH
jgi:uncharacterized membrane protein YkoI